MTETEGDNSKEGQLPKDKVIEDKVEYVITERDRQDKERSNTSFTRISD